MHGTTLSRREMLRWAGAGAAALVLSPRVLAVAEEKEKAHYPFELPKLPYALDALEPHIDAQTMGIHHGKHHQAYVTNLNAALKDCEPCQKKSIEELVAGLDKVPEKTRNAVRNNGGGHLNHSWFWQMMSAKGGGEPKGALGKAIDESFGGFDKFQTAFTAAAMTRFGSGWAWLIVGKDKPLAVMSTANQDNPITAGQHPILGLDVWEHAYYLKYQNKRADYVKAWWNVVNWEMAAHLFDHAKKSG